MMEALPLINIALPKVVEPSENDTVPVGVPDPEVTVAANVTVCPKPEGFGVEVTVVLVAVVPTCRNIPTSLPPPQPAAMHPAATKSGSPSPLRSETANALEVPRGTT